MQQLESCWQTFSWSIASRTSCKQVASTNLLDDATLDLVFAKDISKVQIPIPTRFLDIRCCSHILNKIFHNFPYRLVFACKGKLEKNINVKNITYPMFGIVIPLTSIDEIFHAQIFTYSISWMKYLEIRYYSWSFEHDIFPFLCFSIFETEYFSYEKRIKELLIIKAEHRIPLHNSLGISLISLLIK